MANADEVTTSELTSLRAQVATLRRYAQHKGGCARFTGPYNKCDCGQAELLTQTQPTADAFVASIKAPLEAQIAALRLQVFEHKIEVIRASLGLDRSTALLFLAKAPKTPEARQLVAFVADHDASIRAPLEQANAKLVARVATLEVELNMLSDAKPE